MEEIHDSPPSGVHDSPPPEILSQASTLSKEALSLDKSIGGDSIGDKIDKISDKMLTLISAESKRNILSYYRLWMLYIITWFNNLFIYIQLITIILDKNSEGVSFDAYIILLLSSISWFVYGFLLKDFVLIVSNVIKLIGVVALLVVIPKYS